MALIEDSVDKVKTALLVAIKNELTETYPVQFGDYKTSRGDTQTKIYWSDTVRYQPKFPYCILTPQSDESSGYDEIVYLKKDDGVFIKRNITRSTLLVSIDIFNMGNEQLNISNLEADSFAHKVSRQLRKYFNGDGKLDWFSGNEYYPRQIGITVNSDISSTMDWIDTDVKFMYTFDIQLGWNDISDTIIDTAQGAVVYVEDGEKYSDEFTVKINKSNNKRR